MTDLAHAEHHDPRRKYWGVFAALIVGTILTVAATHLDIGREGNIALALLIASVKVGLVATIFMHLKGEEKLLYGIALFPIVLLLIVIFLVLPDVGLAPISPAELQNLPTPSPH